MKKHILSMAIIISMVYAGKSNGQITTYCVLNGVGTHCPATVLPATVPGIISDQQPTGGSNVPSYSVPYDIPTMRSGYNNTPNPAPTMVNGEIYGSNAKDIAARRKAYSGGTVASAGDVGSNISMLYPNPVLANTRIVLNKLTTSPVAVDVVDFNGIIIRSYDYAAGIYNLDVDMSGLPTGIYSVRVFGKDIPMENLKVVKQ